MKHRINRIGCK